MATRFVLSAAVTAGSELWFDVWRVNPTNIALPNQEIRVTAIQCALQVYSSVAKGLTLCTFSTIACFSASEVAAANLALNFLSFFRRARRWASSRVRSIRPIVISYSF